MKRLISLVMSCFFWNIPGSFSQKWDIGEVFSGYKLKNPTLSDYGLEKGIQSVKSVPYNGEWVAGVEDEKEPYGLLREGKIAEQEGEHFQLVFNKKGELIEEVHWNALGEKTYHYHRVNHKKAREEFYEVMNETSSKNSRKKGRTSIIYYFDDQGRVTRIIDKEKKVLIEYTNDSKILKYLPDGIQKIKVFSDHKPIEIYDFQFSPQALTLTIQLEDGRGILQKQWSYEFDQLNRIKKKEVRVKNGPIEVTEYHYEGNSEEPVQIGIYQEVGNQKKLLFESKRIEQQGNKEVKVIKYWDGASWVKKKIETSLLNGKPVTMKVFFDDGSWEEFHYDSKAHLIKHIVYQQDGSVKFKKEYVYEYSGKDNLWNRKIIIFSDYGKKKPAEYIIVKREYQFW